MPAIACLIYRYEGYDLSPGVRRDSMDGWGTRRRARQNLSLVESAEVRYGPVTSLRHPYDVARFKNAECSLQALQLDYSCDFGRT